MSRKNTIIISVMINTALLAVLFAFSVTKNSEEKITKKTSILEDNIVDAKDLFSSSIKDDPANFIQENLASDNLTENLKEPLVIDNKNSQVAIENKLEDSFIPLKEENESKPDEKVIYKLPKMAKNTQNIIKPKDDLLEITVKKGDSLEKIARLHNTKVSDLKKINNLSSNFLKIGQKLLISSSLEKSNNYLPSNFNNNSTTISQKKELAKIQNTEYYTVKVGDNPYTIAIKNSIKLSDLLKLNNLDEKKARKLKPGDKLQIR